MENKVVSIFVHTFHGFTGEHLDTFFSIQLCNRLRQISGESERRYTGFWKNHCDVLAVHRECRRDFRADKSSSDDRESITCFGQLSQAPIIVERSKIDDRLTAERQT